MAQKFYVASCMFTELEPALSRTVQAYVRECFNLPIIRCCVANYRVADCDNRVPDWYREEWRAIKHYEKFPAGSTLVSICHNCSAIYEEQHPEIQRESIWELILSDEDFKYPNHGGEAITIQDCWRAKENSAEQAAVRELLRRMNFEVVELPENHEQTKFCGYTLYQPQPARNPALAPKRFRDGAQGLFQPHTDEQKRQLMREHCSQITTEKVAAYCHYCLRGLKLGNAKAFHLAELLFQTGKNIPA